MPISKEQAVEIKKQLLLQVEKMNDPNKDQIKKYISGLDEKQLEDFLKQNKIDYSSDEKTSQAPQECIFCSIVKGKIPSYKIAETKKAVGILEINPLSKGHSIVVPVKHENIEEIPKSVLTFAQKIAKKIKKKFKPEDVKIETTNFEGHAIINVIPIYKDVPVQKRKADEKELKQVQYKLEIKRRSKRKKDNTPPKDAKNPSTTITKEVKSNVIRLPRRVP
jgi:histidine triad (HIT) family protein